MRDLRLHKATEPGNVCSVAAAVIGSAVIGAGAGILGSKSAAKTEGDAALRAAEIQAAAANRAADIQLHMFDTIRGDLSGYRGLGTDATAGYRALLGLPSGITAASTGGANTTTAPGGTPPPPAVTAPMKAGEFNWAQVLKDRPDVLDQYNKIMQTADRNSPWFAQHGLDKGPEGFAEWWYNNRPPEDMKPDGSGPYTAPQWTQEQIDALYPPSAGASGAGTGGGTSAAGAAGAGPALSGNGIQDYLESLPGYKFVRDQGIKSTTNALASKGLGGISGPMAKGISRFVTGLADTTYGEQVARLASAVNTGVGAATQTGNFGTTAASNAGNTLVGGANASAAGITGAANASAAGTVGAANAVSNAAANAASGYITSRVLNRGIYSGGGLGP